MTQKVLREHESSFDLKKHGRTDGNNRNYVQHTVKAMFESARTSELLKLGELYGFFGHQRRQIGGKIRPAEVEVIMLEGKPVVIENVPSNRTIELNLSDDGIVTHKEQILATPSGQIVNAMLESAAGGWSWAVTGVPTRQGAHARDFHGFDYVNQPSYIDTDRMSAMFESVGVDNQDDLIRYNLKEIGIDDPDSLLGRWDNNSMLLESVEDLQSEILMLEGMLANQQFKSDTAIDEVRTELNQIKAEREAHEAAMYEAVNSLGFVLTEEQKGALIGMKTDHDKQVVTQMFESIAKTDLSSLPNLGGNNTVVKSAPSVDKSVMDRAVVFTQKPIQFR